MGRSISDRMSYRNHYMCSGEATSNTNTNEINWVLFIIICHKLRFLGGEGFGFWRLLLPPVNQLPNL